MSRLTDPRRPWRLVPGTVASPDLVFVSPDSTLTEMIPVMEASGWFDLDSGLDTGTLTMTVGTLPLAERGGGQSAVPDRRNWLVVGADPEATFAPVHARRDLGLVAMVSTPPADRSRAVLVGLHGFHTQASDPDRSFSLTLVDDWGIEDVMAVAWDAALRDGEQIGLMIDLAVLDPVYEPGCLRTRPGGLSLRQLCRAARWAGRQPGATVVALAKATSLSNLAQVAMSFSAGLAAR